MFDQPPRFAEEVRAFLRVCDLRPSGAERLARYRIFIDSCRIDSRSAAAIVCCRPRGEMIPGIPGNRRGWSCRSASCAHRPRPEAQPSDPKDLLEGTGVSVRVDLCGSGVLKTK